MEISKAFKGYARSYKIELIDSKDLLAQLEASKTCIKYFLKDILDKMKGFKYQITMKFLLCKYNGNGEKEFAPVYFNSATKTVTNSEKYRLDRSFQGISYKRHNWINERSGWINESIQSQYVNISVYSTLSGST